MSRRAGAQPQWEERLDPRRQNPLWGEHRARYRFAKSQARGARILDVACGSGYGAAMLRAAGGAHVVAVDFSAEAVALATRLYRPSADFLRGDLEALPFRSGVFDLVTCFETIEHVRRPETGIREIARVLTSRGALLVSSPNGAFFPTGHSGNPFHHTEFRPDELADLLAPHFKHVLISGQRLARPTPGILNYSGAPVQHEALTPAKPTLRRWLFGRLPYLLQDLVWRVVHGESYYPREEEFVLEAEHPERFPVIIAVCQRE